MVVAAAAVVEEEEEVVEEGEGDKAAASWSNFMLWFCVLDALVVHMLGHADRRHRNESHVAIEILVPS